MVAPASLLFDALEDGADDAALAVEMVAFRGGDEIVRAWSRAELVKAAGRAAGAIRAGADAGDRVIVALPPGLDTLAATLGCFGSGRIAVPAQPPGTARAQVQLARLQTTLGARLVLTSAEQIIGPATALERPAPEGVAYLQFTSGSTQAPRGAVITHAALDANIRAISQSWGLGAGDRGVFWLPPWHDMGLVGALLAPVALRFPATLLHPAAFLQRPLRWLQLVSSRRATFSGAPNFAYDLCVDRTALEARDGLDLSCWRIAVNGAEPVRASTLERFSDAFAGCGFRASAFKPGYGLAESVLFVTACPEGVSYGVSRGRVCCGRPASGADIRIVDPETGAAAPEGTTGEIWVRGPSVAAGYWEAPEATAAAFGARLPGDPSPWLRTGDLGWLDDGALFVSGRLKDIVIRAGRNIHAGDVEFAIRRRCGGAFNVAVLDMDEGARERLVVLHDAAPDLMPRAIIEDVLGRDFDLVADTIEAVPPGMIRLTSSGKVARAATRAAWLNAAAASRSAA